MGMDWNLPPVDPSDDSDLWDTLSHTLEDPLLFHGPPPRTTHIRCYQVVDKGGWTGTGLLTMARVAL